MNVNSGFRSLLYELVHRLAERTLLISAVERLLCSLYALTFILFD